MSLSDHRRNRRPSVRRGYLMTELVVAAGILLTAMTFVASMAPRLGRLWQQTAHQRTAMTELSNQLERLTQLPKHEVHGELDSLQPSALAASALPGAELTGELVDDALGPRVVLRLSWQRRPAGQPVELVGWLHPPAAASPDATAEGDS